jgi:hypothetical protein
VRAVPGFAATMNVTVPLPLPDVALLMVIHGALLVAVQAHPAVVVIATLPTPPVASMFCVAGAIEYVHAGGGAACVTVKV